MKPLEGVRVLTFEQFGAGPYASMLLADLGAEVIKVENAATGGDAARHVGPHMLASGDSQYFQTWNMNKKSVALDIKTAEGRAGFEQLVKSADAVMNNLRGDQPEKLRLDYASLKPVNPRIVCLHISAYGRDNERKAWPGYDFLMQAEAGVMGLTGEPDGPPTRVGASMVDFMTGATGATGLLACILRAHKTGAGCDVDTCLFDVAMHQLSYAAVWYLNAGEASRRQPRSAHLSVAPVQTFPTADGWIFVMCMTDKFWDILVDVLSRPDLKAEARFATAALRRKNRDALTEILDQELRKRPTREWIQAFAGLLPVAPVFEMDEALDAEFAQQAGMVRNVPTADRADFRVLANPIKIDGKRAEQVAAPVLGADNDALLGERATGDDAGADMKLEGLRIIDLSSFLPGPYLTMMMADHGAEVIKIEQPGEGDPGRHIGPSDGPATVFFRNLNRGKKSVVLDLKATEQRDLLLALCETADVFVETFRPGVADRLGVSYAPVSARNPRIVYCSISAFGHHGPYRGRPAHDLALEAMSGVLSMTLGNDDKPVIPGIAIADQLSAQHGLAGILMALLRRQSTGRGDYIDIAMHDATLAACANIVGPVMAEGRQPVAKHERSTGGAAFYQIYETRDGRHIVLAGQEPKFIRNLMNALDRPDLIAPCLSGPGPHQRPVIDFLQATFGTMSADQALTFLSGLDVCFGRVNTLPEAFEDENVKARGMVLRDDHGRRHIAPVVRFLDEPPAPDLRAPALGEHTQEIVDTLRRRKSTAA